MTKEELSLIRAVQAGNEDAFNEMFDRYYIRAYAIAYRIMNCDADAHDAAQETMLEVYRSIANLKEPSYFYAWMIRIVISKCNRIYRKNKEMITDPYKMQASQDYEEKRVYMLPDQESDNQMEREILIALIYSLKPRYSQVLDMMYLRQMKLHEIANDLDISINTVKSRIVRGRDLLKDRIHEYETYENRKIHFHAHMPLSLFSMSYLLYLARTSLKRLTTKVTSYASGGVLQSACVLSFTLLVISGTVFAAEDMMADAASTRNPVQESGKESLVPNEIIDAANQENDFLAVPYAGEMITSSIDAYYTCLNWAWSREEMKTKSKEEIEAIMPVYHSLKKKQDIFYLRLQEKGWVASFETLDI